MAGEMDEQSQAIGQLQTGVANLECALHEHSRRDEEYRRERDRKSDAFQDKALTALAKLDSVVEAQKDHAAAIEAHGARIASIEQARAAEATERAQKSQQRRVAVLVRGAWVGGATAAGGAMIWLLSTFWTQLADIIISGSGMDGR